MSEISVESVPVVMPDQAVERATREAPPPPEPPREQVTDESVGRNVDVTA